MKKFYSAAGASALSLAVILSSCGSLQSLNNNTVKGAGIGTGAGAAIGAGVGYAAGNAGIGAAIGAVLGGVAGGLIGNHMDKQAKELEAAIPDAQVETVNNGEAIKVTFDSGILFGFDQSVLTADSQEALARFAENMNANPDTDIQIIGYTDSTGTDEYNQKLSERRAESVYNFLRTKAVASERMLAVGKGEADPVADNSTKVGQQKNRRVEVFILPNAKMIREAQAQAAQQK